MNPVHFLEVRPKGSKACGEKGQDPGPLGLRDRVLIATMVYTFARVGAVTKKHVEDVFIQGRRTWVRLHEKGGKRVDMPCHHKLEEYLDAYIDGTGVEADVKGYLFRTARGRTNPWRWMSPPGLRGERVSMM